MARLTEENNLYAINPDLCKEWDYSKNEITPDQVSYGSNKRVWWRCSKGHSWEARINTRSFGSGCPYCSGLKPIKGENDLATLRPDLVKEWDYENNDKRPEDISYKSSNKKVYWRCNKGHLWKATVYNRVTGSSCPYCRRSKEKNKTISLSELRPDVLKEWNYEKNEIKPDELSYGSGKVVWWRCSKGHDWKASVNHRIRGCKCPYCSGRYIIKGKNDLATLKPELAKEWDYTKNELTPYQVKVGSNRKVWWKCSEGHSWEAVIQSRSRSKGVGCPYCRIKKSKIGISKTSI